MLDLTLLVVGKDQSACDQFPQPPVKCDLRLVTNYSGMALSRLANRHLAASAPAFGLVHADTVFRPGALEAFTAAALDGAVCGIVGRQPTREYLNRWCFDNPGPVSTLDGCSVFFRPDSGLRFDEQAFDSFHCHVEDLCVQAQEKGMPVLVPAADATHNGPLPCPEWQAKHAIYHRRLVEKWPGREIWTT